MCGLLRSYGFVSVRKREMVGLLVEVRCLWASKAAVIFSYIREHPTTLLQYKDPLVSLSVKSEKRGFQLDGAASYLT